MKQPEAIEKLLKDNAKKKIWLADQIGVKQNSVSQMLKRGSITVDTLYKICEALEYEITIQPKRRQGMRPIGQIVIEGKGSAKKKEAEEAT